MRVWFALLGGLLVWAAHFFALYGIGEFAGVSTGSRAMVLLFTALALAAVSLLVYLSWRPSTSDELENWSFRIGRSAWLLAALAIIWQALPAALP